MTSVRVWDLPTRLFHWLLALLVVGLVITGKIGGATIDWHARLGYAILALLLFRLVWGLVGGHWSRFASFIYSPGTMLAYLRGQGRPEHSVGHNPLGALSVFGLLLILSAQVGTGLISDDEISFTGPLSKFVSSAIALQATAYHKEWGQWIIIGLGALHVAAILFYALVRKDNLVRPMITGDKTLDAPLPSARDDLLTRVAALVLVGACAGVVTWLVKLGS